MTKLLDSLSPKDLAAVRQIILVGGTVYRIRRDSFEPWAEIVKCQTVSGAHLRISADALVGVELEQESDSDA